MYHPGYESIIGERGLKLSGGEKVNSLVPTHLHPPPSSSPHLLPNSATSGYRAHVPQKPADFVLRRGNLGTRLDHGALTPELAGNHDQGPYHYRNCAPTIHHRRR
ncbi:hypothetical protein BC936DRAFT_138098 [Jimgerdemannia flammicorona]|uniref:Uncharacterized protein n=1 Tax=Jimgerdemannia flammicorona TaxID=994334 RepID=A0A433DIQ1_9FUNG|nr:hypothetical protein BC936DRAFT_138098 [Jimgerdemannia flammicorona]